MEGIEKAFPGVIALDGASLRVAPGEVHAVIGQNGAGKSTLMKILNGAYRRDAGTILLDGQPVDFHNPREAQDAGVSTIYQEINLVPYRSVAENIFMGREPRRWGMLDRERMNRDATAVLDRLGVHVDVRRPLSTLNIALQQMVAIARAISTDARIVIMDEPTSSLDEREVEVLFDVIRGLKADGISAIYISHRLDELYAVCDRVTIMRDGKTIDERAVAGASKVELVARMLGKEIGEVSRSGATGFQHRGARPAGEVLVEADDLQGARLDGASVTVRSGEIVGLAGLLGSGRTEVARAVFGADPASGGLRVRGKPVRWKSPRDAIRAGFGFSSEDRKADGIIPYMSVRENLTLAALPVLSRNGIVDRTEQQRIVDRFIDRLGIKTAGPEQKIRELSGGNQQKVLLARWLCLNPSLLLLDEPTRGIDVGAKAEIQGLIDELADNGLGVLMISSELEEITEGADRVVVLREGRTVAEFDHVEVSQDTVMHAMAHGDDESRSRGVEESSGRRLQAQEDGETVRRLVGATPASPAPLDER
ncbi:MAG: sugar ABC transporter ATP-binding protein [Chloroflexi bacterium]|nr:sugar ABC transporter ATP-binding protein [Chloroflexota bacterium]